MVCIYCGGKTQVINSRGQKRLNQVWRRRKCLDCSNIISTIERVNFSSSLLITNKSGKIEDFVKEKLLFSIHNSLGHRQDPIGDAVAITDTIMSNLIKTLKTPLIDRNTLVSISFDVLNKFDKPGAVHYAAYYPVNN